LTRCESMGYNYKTKGAVVKTKRDKNTALKRLKILAKKVSRVPKRIDPIAIENEINEHLQTKGA